MSSNGMEMTESHLLIRNTCTRLKLTRTVRTTAQIIYNYVYPILSNSHKSNRLAFSSVYLAAKVNEEYQKAEFFKSATGFTVDVSLEHEIVNALEFKFEYFDMHGFLDAVCVELKIDSLEYIAKLDNIFSSIELNKIGLVKDGLSPVFVCLSLLNNSELELFEQVYCVRIDKKLIENICKSIY